MAENEDYLKCLPKQRAPYRDQQGMIHPGQFSNQAFQTCLNCEIGPRITFVCVGKRLLTECEENNRRIHFGLSRE